MDRSGALRTAARLVAEGDDAGAGAELFRWTLDPSAASEAVAILNSHPDAAMGWYDSLAAMIDADPTTRDSIWQGVSLALSALADPRVLDAVSPGPHEQFDPETLLTEQGTLHLLATGAGAGASASLVAAFVEDLIETARRLAARSPGASLIRRCCSRSMRLGTSRPCRRSRRSWLKAAAPASRPCPCCSRPLKPATGGASIRPARSGTPAS